jgi:uncharacterized membrane protein
MTRWLYLALAATVLATAGSVYVSVIAHDRLPERIPIHWDINGQPDRFVDRDNAWVNFWLTPGIMAGFILLTLVLPWLSPKPFVVDTFRDTYGYVMALVVCLLGYIQGLLLWMSLHPDANLVRPMVAGILFFLALMGNVLGRVRRNFWIGVRTPWTLANDLVWEKTHRLAAWLLAGFGLLGCVAVLAGAPLLWCFIALMVVLFVPGFYSLAVYKRLEREGRI